MNRRFTREATAVDADPRGRRLGVRSRREADAGAQAAGVD
jgi:hypothetical protein